MTANYSIAQPSLLNNTPIKFNSDGWPLNPQTSQPYTRDEIVANPSIPYPRHVNPTKPGAYWARRTPAQLEAEKAKIAKKEKARRSHRNRSKRRTMANTVPFLAQQEHRHRATADLVTRANEDEPETHAILVTCGEQFSILEV
jgi:hypothetical protein